MKKLFTHLKQYRKECVLGPLFKFFEACLELAVPLVVSSIIDHGIADGDGGYVLRMSLLLVAFGAIGLLFSVVAQYFSAKAAVGFAARLKHALFAHIQGFSCAEVDRVGTSTLITRMTSDMNQVQTGLNLTLRLLLRSPFVVFGALVMALTIDVPVALVFVGVIPLLSVVIFFIMLTCIPRYGRVQTKVDGILRRTRQNLHGVRVVRAFRREEGEIASFEKENQELTSMQKSVGRLSAALNPLTYVLINLAVILLLRQGAIRVSTGGMTQGEVVAMYNYMSQILVELVKLANLIITVTKAVASMKRIGKVMELPSSEAEVLDSPDGAPLHEAADLSSPAIEFRHVTFRYHETGEAALSDVSFSLRRGETLGVIGGTGSGKSTLVNLIPRLYSASEGQVLVDGVDVSTLPLEGLRRKIGLVPQKPLLFSGTIAEQLRFGSEDATDEELLSALSLARGEDILRTKEDGLAATVAAFGKNFSGGQRQRLTIARALVRQPRILILDDSASALDLETEAQLRKNLQAMKGNTTVVIVSQRTSSIRHADKIIVLDEGKAVGIGTHEELLGNCAVYREIYDSQYGGEEVRA